MNYSDLKEKVCFIELNDEAKERIIKNCENKLCEKENKNMKIRSAKIVKKPALVFGILLICLCIPITCMAVTQTGVFKDIKNSDGTIVGTEYESGEGEVSVSADADDKVLNIVVCYDTKVSPYKYQDAISLGKYEIIDDSGNVVLKDIGEEFVQVNDGVATFKLDLNGLESGEYKLIINSFVGSKKADQNITISGNWECVFVL